MHRSPRFAASATRATNSGFTASSSPGWHHVTYPVHLVIRDTTSSDREAQAVWAEPQAERLEGMTLFARDLHDHGACARGVSASEARDVLLIYNCAELFQLLVLERGGHPSATDDGSPTR